MLKKIFTIVGARPQFIKAAAVSRAMRFQPELKEFIIHTGQHYDDNMSGIFFEQLGIPNPHHHFSFGGGSHGQMTGRMIEALEKIFINEKPDAVLIYGDTNSTLAGALAAAKIHIPVIHIEAGLRSYNKKMPEEINRIISDQISDILLCPTRSSVDNLLSEGITNGVHMVGDVMFDATLYAISNNKGKKSELDRLGIPKIPFALCTIHRAENTNDVQRFNLLLDFLYTESKERLIVLPLHPRTRKLMDGLNNIPEKLKLIDPLNYFDLQLLLEHCNLVITDSGGLQKEAYFHQKPCITLRDETEWTETIEAGWNRLWTSDEWIYPRKKIYDYGAGDSAAKCVDIIHEFLCKKR